MCRFIDVILESPFNSPVTCLTRFMFYSLEVDDDNDGSFLDRF